MGWPEWVVLVMFLLGIADHTRTDLKNKDFSSDRITARLFAYIFGLFCYAMLLHAGGFW